MKTGFLSIATIGYFMLWLSGTQCLADEQSMNFGKELHFGACTNEQTRILGESIVRDFKDANSLQFKYAEMHWLKYAAGLAVERGDDIECGRYPDASSEDLFFLRLTSKCLESYCYTFTFDAFGAKYGLTDDPLEYLGLTRDSFFETVDARKTPDFENSGIIAPYGRTVWIDFQASGKIKFMLPPMIRR